MAEKSRILGHLGSLNGRESWVASARESRILGHSGVSEARKSRSAIASDHPNGPISSLGAMGLGHKAWKTLLYIFGVGTLSGQES